MVANATEKKSRANGMIDILFLSHSKSELATTKSEISHGGGINRRLVKTPNYQFCQSSQIC
jgi:hypothetical protein